MPEEDLKPDFDEKKLKSDLELHENQLSQEVTRLSDAVGRQIELERTNTIKYRTCSWQKVGSAI